MRWSVFLAILFAAVAVVTVIWRGAIDPWLFKSLLSFAVLVGAGFGLSALGRKSVSEKSDEPS